MVPVELVVGVVGAVQFVEDSYVNELVAVYHQLFLVLVEGIFHLVLN